MEGVVIKSTGNWYQVLDSNGNIITCRIKGKFRIKGIKTTNPLAVGDLVEFDTGFNSQENMITDIKPRKNYIIRKSINLSKQAHIIAANIDQALLIVTLVNPRTSLGFIDRFLVTAQAYQIPVVLVFNKIDVLDEQQIQEQQDVVDLYQNIGYTCIKVSALGKQNLDKLQHLMKDKVSLISGHSGVGKSSLVNAVEPTLDLKTAQISAVHHKGMHTTTFAEMFSLSFGGFIIDTPGIKEFGLIDMKKDELSLYFPEFNELRSSCQFSNCMHLNEPKCAVKKALEQGTLSDKRYESYLSMLTSDEIQNNIFE